LGTNVGGNFPEANIIQLVTIFPVFLIIVVLDAISVKNIWTIFQKAKLENKDRRKEGILKLAFSVGIEFALAIISFVIAVLEASGYRGDAPAFIDWWLISWTAGSVIDQKYIIRDILKKSEVKTSKHLVSEHAPTNRRTSYNT
jgi:hypothetical protein